jgi:hypothetical protein
MALQAFAPIAIMVVLSIGLASLILVISRIFGPHDPTKRKNAPYESGMKPIGPTLVGNFQQGQSLDVPIQLTPNKCYSVVAASLPPVTEVNVQLQLVTPIPGAAPVLAIDQDSGPTAVLGKKATCYRWMLGSFPAPAKVVVQVVGGSGLVAAQAYEK